eukprot:scaffold70215_cov65-Phaeocystis_antarctica.AAC.1
MPVLLTVGMKRAAAAALTGHAPKRQKLYRTNLTPGQPKMCHVCRRMLPSRNKLMLHLARPSRLHYPHNPHLHRPGFGH